MKPVLTRYSVMLALLAATQAFALPSVRSDITVYDGDSSTSSSWYGSREDQEVEPGMVRSQAWDMESFFVEPGNGDLGMISGFDFKDGYGGFKAGDIFIDVDGSFIPGDATTSANGYAVESATTFGYEYVLDVDWTSIDGSGTGAYTVYQLDANALVTKPYYQQNYGSGPFEYVGGGIQVESGTFSFEEGLSDADTGFLGGSHYAAFGFDLSFLADLGYQEYWTSTAMGCGNDHLLGHNEVSSVPEPTSIALLALGVVGLTLARRRTR